ncbi:MAG: hypothetical protein RBS80_23620 [Thermoguttaceae bacterium]|jgi:hypothetical protein|nr:hypothetical protein [Thermoguttaceae bacterium]
MRPWILSLAAAVGAVMLVAQPAAAETGVAVTPAVLTIDSDGASGGASHAIHEVRHRHHRGRPHFYYDYRRPHWGPSYYRPHPSYRPYGHHGYHRHYYYGHPRGGVYFHGPRVGVGIGW